MFRMPAYDPVAIAVFLGCGVLLAAALAFPFWRPRGRTPSAGPRTARRPRILWAGVKCASCVGTTRFQCGKDAWRLLTAWLAGTQMKSPGRPVVSGDRPGL